MYDILDFLIERGCTVKYIEGNRWVELLFANREIEVTPSRVTFFIIEDGKIYMAMEESSPITSTNRDTLYQKLNDHFEKIAMDCL